MIFIAFQLGLGDCINYASLIAQFAAQEEVVIPCTDKNRKNVKSFFYGLPIHLMRCNNNEEVWHWINKVKRLLPLEIFAPGEYHPYNHIKDGYEAAGLSYADRNTFCPIRNQIKKIVQIGAPSEKYVFIPEGGSTGEFHIDRSFIENKYALKLIPPQNALLLAYANIIEFAEEIHCHDTSWPWMIDKIPTTGKLFFHEYARDCKYDYDTLLTKPWIRIKEKPISESPAKSYPIIYQDGRIIIER